MTEHKRFKEEYQNLSEEDRDTIWRYAGDELREQGFEEIGSSDISCWAYDRFKAHGSLKAALDYLTN
jgi:hypothetical protein